MAETPETPTPSLADELERCGWALHLELPAAVAVDVQKLTDAAAAQLRQLDRIKAIVQSSRCPWLGLGYEEPGCGECGLCRIRDALEADDGA